MEEEKYLKNRFYCKIPNKNKYFCANKALKILGIVGIFLFFLSFQKFTLADTSNSGNILRARELSERDFENLIPTPQGIQYYLNTREHSKIKKGTKYKTMETSFITLLPIDYKLIANFINESFLEEGKLKSIDGIMETLPNLMNYLQTMSSKTITKRITPYGDYRNVYICYTIDKAVLAKKYPQTNTIISQGYIRTAGFTLLDENQYPLLESRMKGEKITIQFSVDNNGYIVNPQNTSSKKTPQRTSSIFFYLDSNFEVEATLLKILKLCSVKVDKIRFLFNLTYSPEAITLSWQAVDTQVTDVRVTGFNAETIKSSLSNMKGTFQGETIFEPASYHGDHFTFMRITTHGERIDDWLTDIAILTWEQIGLSVLNELKLPIGEGLSAFKKDLLAISTIR